MTKEQMLLADLDSEKRTVKVSAVVQLSKMTVDRQILRRLQQMTTDTDREIALFANQAVGRILARIGETGAGHGPGEEITKEHFATPLKDEIPRLLAFVREKGAGLAEDWRPVVADFLEKHGTTEDGAFLVNWLETSDSAMGVTYLEALEKIAPKLLIQVLPRVLASEHPLVRVRAIVSLQRVDPEESIAHLRELLASRKAEDRIAGLSISFVYKFGDVKPLVLTMIAEETDPDVLRSAEILFVSNPEVDVALKLLDIMDMLPKAQGVGISKIFKQLCETLKLTGTLSPEKAKPEAIIALWRAERLKKFLGDLEIQLAVGNKAKREAIEAWLAKNLSNTDVRGFVEKLALNPATEEIFKKLCGPKEPSKTAQAKDLEAPEKKSPDEKKNLIEGLDEPTFRKYLSWVRMEAASGTPPVRTAAMNAMFQFGGDRADVFLAEKNLTESDPFLVLASMRFLEKAEAKKLDSFLPRLISHADPAVRGRAIRLIVRSDPGRAIETISGMLRSPDPATRAQSVGVLMFCPFERILPIMIETLAKETHVDIARQILVVLLSNPGSRVLDALDRLQTVTNPGVSMLIAQARIDIFDLVLQYGMETFDTPSSSADGTVPVPDKVGAEPLNGEKGKTPSGEKEKPENKPAPQAPPPSGSASQKSSTGWSSKPYSVVEVRNTMRKREAAHRASSTKPTEIPNAPAKNYAWVGAVLLGAACLGVFLSLAVGKGEKTAVVDSEAMEKPTVSELPKGVHAEFTMGERCVVTGKVEFINPDGSLRVSLPDKRMVYVKFVASYPALRGSETVELEIIPFKKIKSGDILSDGLKLTEK